MYCASSILVCLVERYQTRREEVNCCFSLTRHSCSYDRLARGDLRRCLSPHMPSPFAAYVRASPYAADVLAVVPGCCLVRRARLRPNLTRQLEVPKRVCVCVSARSPVPQWFGSPNRHTNTTYLFRYCLRLFGPSIVGVATSSFAACH